MSTKRILKLSLLMVFMLVLVACGQNDETTKITLDKSNVTLKVSETAVVKATVENTDETINWSIENPEIASFVMDDTGLEVTVEGLTVGSTTLNATIGDVEQTVQITVEKAVLEGVPKLSVDQRNVSLFIGETKRLEAEVRVDNVKVDATINFVSNRPEHVTVNDNGELTGVAIGSAIIEVSATYKGVNLETSVTVVVLENLSLELDVSNVTLYISSNGEDQLTSVQVEATLVLNSEEVNLDEIVWSTDNEDVAVVENGLITAVGYGNANITASYESPTNQIVEQTVAVEVLIPVVETDESFDVAYKTSSVLDLESLGVLADDVVEIIDQTTGQHKVLFTPVSDTEIELNVNDIIAGVRQYVIYTNEEGLIIEMHLITKVILNAQDLADFSLEAREFYGTDNPHEENGVSYYPRSGGYYVLGADIDFEGERFETIGIWAGDKWLSVFDGILDGRGHTVYNFKVDGANGAIFVKLEPQAVVKNISFIDAFVGWAGSLIAIEHAGTIENVYVSGYLRSGVEWSQNSLLIGRFTDGAPAGNIKDVVIHVTGIEGSLNGAVIGNISGFDDSTFNNVIVVGTTKAAGLRGGANYTTSHIQSFATLEDYQAVSVDLSAFDETYWHVEDGYVPVFNTYVARIVDGLIITNEDKTVSAGVPKKISIVGNLLVSYLVEPAIDGVEINAEGMIEVDSSVDVGTQIQVFVRHQLTGLTTSETFEVVSIPITDLTDLGVLKVIELGRDDQDKSITLPDVDSMVTSLSIYGENVEITTDETTVSFTIDPQEYNKLVLGDSVELLAQAEDGNRYKFTVSIYSLILMDKDDYQLFTEVARASGNDGTPFVVDGVTYYKYSDGYFILGADIDLEDGPNLSQVIGAWHDPSADFIGKFKGILDGRGHTISNIKFDADVDATAYGNIGMFLSIDKDGIVRNINFEGVNLMWNRGGGLVALENHGLIENISVHGLFQWGSPYGWSHSGLLIRNLGPEGKIKNIIVHTTEDFPGGLGAFIIGQVNEPLSSGQIENVILIGSTRAVATWGEDGNNDESIEITLDEIDTFETMDDYLAANANGEITQRFNLPYWDVSGDVPKINIL